MLTRKLAHKHCGKPVPSWHATFSRVLTSLSSPLLEIHEKVSKMKFPVQTSYTALQKCRLKPRNFVPCQGGHCYAHCIFKAAKSIARANYWKKDTEIVEIGNFCARNVFSNCQRM